MKKIYNRYIRIIENFLGQNQYLKMWVAEHYALRKKRNLTKNVRWSKDQEKEFKSFWKDNYKVINSDGVKFFQAFNDQFNAEYIPDYLYATEIESKFNSYLYSKIYSDKGLLDILYKNKTKALTPKTILLNSEGILYNSERHIISKEEAKDILSSVESAVIKPTVGGNSGKGVIVGTFNKDGFDTNEDFSIFSLLSQEQKNFIVQEKITQSDELNKLYPNSINTFRVITFVADSAVHLAPISLRLGSGGNVIDNIHAGGLVVGLDEKGELMKYAFQLGYSNTKRRFTEHPDTKVSFQNFRISGLSDVINSAKRLHEFTPNAKIISWDFTINEKYQPILVEANFLGQSIWFSQITSGESIFRKYTSSILKQL
ncbi:hypothetical protein OA84_04740 [Kaistella solincola]|uniref:Alpha-L-glutamate ligase-related protein ATP-grasp domain-containing protein n=1 Tax=Kaistella solincola TaxID=510955 RepID=A0ABR4ZNL0_9FLAO|nr:sugar-transfer associated ATP-grasp domain-containing protein [Kaistella solincola]KIA82880.1 hypothetical protein OA84_04740 [Kaistella solincola]